MLKFIYAIIASVALFGVTPVDAQVNWDIPETKTPGGDPGGDQVPGGDISCMDCCTDAIWNSRCCELCSCQCGVIGYCSFHTTMSTANVAKDVHAHVLDSVAETRDRLTATPRGKMLYGVLEQNEARMTEIFGKYPALATRTGKAVASYWPHNIWTKTGDDAHKVSRQALEELRTIVTQVAKADREMGATAISQIIQTDVLPHLTRDLVGVPYHLAFDCFAAGQSCAGN